MRRDEHDRHNKKVARIQSTKRPLALGHQRVGEVVKSAPPAVAPVVFASRLLVVIVLWEDGLAVTPWPGERAIFPPERMDGGVAGGSVEKLVEMGEHWHG